MSLKYAGAQITAAEERRSAASPSIAAPSQLMTASFPLNFMQTTAEAEFREQREETATSVWLAPLVDNNKDRGDDQIRFQRGGGEVRSSLLAE